MWTVVPQAVAEGREKVCWWEKWKRKGVKNFSIDQHDALLDKQDGCLIYSHIIKGMSILLPCGSGLCWLDVVQEQETRGRKEGKVKGRGGESGKDCH